MSDISAGRPSPLKSEATLFGHPPGLAFLFGTEMWERFSYYGMRSLLVLYMVADLLRPDKARTVIGLDALRHGLESVFGRLSDQAFASEIYGFYTGFAYLTPILGGVLADRFIGRTPTVVLGASLMVAGHFMMAWDRMFLLALVVLVLGVGIFKPNVTTQVGELYGPGDRRVDRAYSIFYVGINVGAFFAPLICGYLGERIDWRYGFISAGVGMVIGMATYLAGRSWLPKAQPVQRIAPDAAARRQARASFASLFILFIPSTLWWAAYEQQGNAIVIWIHRSVDREINLLFWRGTIPVTWFQSFNPILIFFITPVLVAIWSWFAAKGREPATIAKLTTGCILISAAYLLLATVAWSGGQQISWMWLLIFFAVVTVAELYFSPIGISLMSSIAPSGARSSLMAVWFTSIFAGNFLAGYLGSLWEKFSQPAFFLIVASLGMIAALFTLAARPLLARTLPQPRQPIAASSQAL